MPEWFTSSSPESDQHQCEMLRYLGYHSGPEKLGMRRDGASVPKLTGAAFHEVMAQVVQRRIDHSGPPVREILRERVELYLQEIAGKQFEGEQAQETERIAQEQIALLQGMVYGWLRTCAPSFYENYEPLVIEQEMPIQVPWGYDSEGISLIRGTKSDLICKRVFDGKLGVWNWKTSAAEHYLEHLPAMPQTQMEAFAAAQHLGKPVDWFGIYGVIKGSRKASKAPTDQTGEYTGPVQQQSVLIYAYHRPQVPPFQEEDLQPNWQYRGSDNKNHTLGKTYTQVPKILVTERMPVEKWVNEHIPQETLNKLFIEMGPYPNEPYKVEQYLRGMAGNEARWRQRVIEVQQMEEELGWDSPEYQAILDGTFSRDYSKCDNLFYRPCPMKGLCTKGQGWQQRVGYVPRDPHYQFERERDREEGE